jgi:hypothetical protein
MAVTVAVQLGQPQPVNVVIQNGVSWTVDQQNRLVVSDATPKVVAVFGLWVYAQIT